MKNTVLWSLVVINGLLLVSFWNRVSRENAAIAQPAGAGAVAAQRAGDYLMIPAEFSGPSVGIVVVLDTNTGRLSAMSLNESARRSEIEVGRAVDLQALFDQAAQQRPR